jgi:hypothetical protein
VFESILKNLNQKTNFLYLTHSLSFFFNVVGRICLILILSGQKYVLIVIIFFFKKSRLKNYFKEIIIKKKLT